jgi:hypothetical protein
MFDHTRQSGALRPPSRGEQGRSTRNGDFWQEGQRSCKAQGTGGDATEKGRLGYLQATFDVGYFPPNTPPDNKFSSITPQFRPFAESLRLLLCRTLAHGVSRVYRRRF